MFCFTCVSMMRQFLERTCCCYYVAFSQSPWLYFSLDGLTPAAPKLIAVDCYDSGLDVLYDRLQRYTQRHYDRADQPTILRILRLLWNVHNAIV